MRFNRDECQKIAELLHAAARFYDTAAFGVPRAEARPLRELTEAADACAIRFAAAHEAVLALEQAGANGARKEKDAPTEEESRLRERVKELEAALGSLPCYGCSRRIDDPEGGSGCVTCRRARAALSEKKEESR